MLDSSSSSSDDDDNIEYSNAVEFPTGVMLDDNNVDSDDDNDNSNNNNGADSKLEQVDRLTSFSAKETCDFIKDDVSVIRSSHLRSLLMLLLVLKVKWILLN